MKRENDGFFDFDFQAEFDNALNKSIHRIPDKLFAYLKKILHETQVSMFSADRMVISLVVDTNILFQEVRSLAINGTSFFDKLSGSPFLKFYGPEQLRTEIHTKIKAKFPKDKATRNLDIGVCIDIAEKLLAKIEINEEVSKEAADYARQVVGNRDPNDVDSFLFKPMQY
jgi:predicted nucleic acid-binding protein